jgi:hypothetical protein
MQKSGSTNSSRHSNISFAVHVVYCLPQESVVLDKNSWNAHLRWKMHLQALECSTESETGSINASSACSARTIIGWLCGSDLSWWLGLTSDHQVEPEILLRQKRGLRQESKSLDVDATLIHRRTLKAQLWCPVGQQGTEP